MDDDLDKKSHDLLFGIRRSVRYHNRRRLFFDRFHKITVSLSLIFGSVTVSIALSQVARPVVSVFAALVAVFAAIDLVFDAPQFARIHNDLARRFIDLEREMVVLPSLSEEDIRNFTARRLEIEADEPPVLRVLNILCHNELMRAMGYADDLLVKISWPKRVLCHFCDLNDASIKWTLYVAFILLSPNRMMMI